MLWYPCYIFRGCLWLLFGIHVKISGARTLPKSNMKPEHGPPEKEIPFGNHHFSSPAPVDTENSPFFTRVFIDNKLFIRGNPTWDVYNPVNNRINYQPQLVRRNSSINTMFLVPVSHTAVPNLPFDAFSRPPRPERVPSTGGVSSSHWTH